MSTLVGFNGFVRRGSAVKILSFQTYRRADAMTVAARSPQVKVDCSDASVAVKPLSRRTLGFFPTPLRIRPILRKKPCPFRRPQRPRIDGAFLPCVENL